MTDASVIAVGGRPTFRHQVARALERDVDGVDWTATVSAAESAMEDRHQPPNVVVLAPGVKEVDAFGLAEFMGRTSPASAVLLVRNQVSNGLLPVAMRAGVREVVDLSQGGEELRRALERAVTWSENLLTVRGTEQRESDGHRAEVFSVFSSKGGTGKTFLATGLALALAGQTGKDTALIDLQFGVGDCLSYFGKEPTHALPDMVGIGTMDDPDAIKEIGVPVQDHLWVFACPPDPSNETPSGEAIGQVISTLRRTFDYVVVDAANDYSDATLSGLDLSDTVCLITGLDVVGVRHLSVGLQTLQSLGFPSDRFRFVLNRADSKVGLRVEQVEKVMNLKVDGMIPSSRLVPSALNEGRTVVEMYPSSDVAKAVSRLAMKLAGVEQRAGKRRMFGN